MLDRRRVSGEALLVGVTIIWGATFSVTRGGLQFVSPLLLIAIRFIGSALIVAPILALLGHKFWKALLPGTILGLLLAVAYSLQTVGLQYTTAARSAFVTYLFAVLVPPLQRLMTDRRMSPGNLLGLAIVVLGTAILTRPWQADGWNRGDMLTLGAAVSLAFFVVLVDRFSRRHDPILFVPAEFAVAGLVAGAAALVAGATGIEPLRFVPNQDLLLAIAFLSIIGTVGALGIQTVMQVRTTPIRATTIFALEPVFAAFFGRVMLAERMVPVEIAGALVIVLGVLISQLWGFLSASVRSRSG
ncbi:MAG: DMT family transporter [Spirochaetales bacterium]|nr:DMT family transporter [Spirochaetales bacterium]